ncbi:MAG: hypothetical protein IJY74_04730, partial [Oscillospiraceae bacterium]|nr:hypothetical protein [Oscillospiraceae bacterium]
MTDAGQAPATITGNGTYNASFQITSGDGTGSIECLILKTDLNAYSYSPEGTSDPLADCGINITIDKIMIDGTEITYNGPSDGAFRLDDDGKTLRVNIYNTWTYPTVADISKEVSWTDTMEVTFTVSGLPGGEVVTTESTDVTTTTTATTTVSDTTQSTTKTTESSAPSIDGYSWVAGEYWAEPGADLEITPKVYNCPGDLMTIGFDFDEEPLFGSGAIVLSPYGDTDGELGDAYPSFTNMYFHISKLHAGGTDKNNGDNGVPAAADGSIIATMYMNVADKAAVEAAAKSLGLELKSDADKGSYYAFPLNFDSSVDP